MNIHTDLINGKRFSSAIKSAVLKRSQEYRVLATLRYLFPTKFKSLNIDESPDLQDWENSVGVEVTSAVSEDEMIVSRIYSELCHDEKKIEKRKEIINKCGYSCSLVHGKKYVINALGTSDKEKKIFQDSIRKKVQKLTQYRTTFSRVGLAILLTDIPSVYAENHIPEWISDIINNDGNSFDFFYVISHRFCICYNAQTNDREKKTLTKDENRRLCTIGRMTAEGELTLSDKEWL